MNAKRGFVPEDERNFSPGALETMRKASRHILYLINEGYDLKSAAAFAGNHFLLSERQRTAIMRSIGRSDRIRERIERKVPLADLAGREVWVDGFNTIITLEVMLSDSILLECMDTSLRDLASLRGTYRLIPQTERAVAMMLSLLEEAGVSGIHILLDAPVSNSGRLKSLIAGMGQGIPGLETEVIKDVDRTLYDKDLVVTSDAIIMDHCGGWIGLTKECMERLGMQGIRVWDREV